MYLDKDWYQEFVKYAVFVYELSARHDDQQP